MHCGSGIYHHNNAVRVADNVVRDGIVCVFFWQKKYRQRWEHRSLVFFTALFFCQSVFGGRPRISRELPT